LLQFGAGSLSFFFRLALLGDELINPALNLVLRNLLASRFFCGGVLAILGFFGRIGFSRRLLLGVYFFSGILRFLLWLLCVRVVRDRLVSGLVFGFLGLTLNAQLG
jgi:hypothetical protein